MDAWAEYYWPDSDVLKNNAGLKTAAGLRAFEYEATRQRAEQLRAAPIPGQFDTAHYRAIHRHLFQDVYDWAGEYRRVDFTKGRSTFALVATPTDTLETWGARIFAQLAAERQLRGLEKPAFVVRLAHYHGALNYWHAMREGNGRANKEFLSQLAKQAGYELAFERVGAKAWNTASERQIADHDSQRVIAAFDKITTPLRALAFRDEPIAAAVAKFPELQGAADILAAAERKAAAEYDPANARVFVAGIHARLVERLTQGDIVSPRRVDPPPRARDDAYTRDGR
jgi:cell filamentation protein